MGFEKGNALGGPRFARWVQRFEAQSFGIIEEVGVGTAFGGARGNATLETFVE